MVNHALCSIANPRPYRGRVLNGRLMSVIEAATICNVAPILERFGCWVITECGIESLVDDRWCVRWDAVDGRPRDFDCDWRFDSWEEMFSCRVQPPRAFVGFEDALKRARQLKRAGYYVQHLSQSE